MAGKVGPPGFGDGLGRLGRTGVGRADARTVRIHFYSVSWIEKQTGSRTCYIPEQIHLPLYTEILPLCICFERLIGEFRDLQTPDVSELLVLLPHSFRCFYTRNCTQLKERQGLLIKALAYVDGSHPPQCLPLCSYTASPCLGPSCPELAPPNSLTFVQTSAYEPGNH